MAEVQDLRRERLSRKVDELLADALVPGDAASPDSATWGLHARVDRAVTDFIAQTAGRDDQSAEAVRNEEGFDAYTFLIVKATMTRRSRISPLMAMAYARPFCPPFEAIEEAILKPLTAIAHSDESPEMREYRCKAVLADWIPEIIQDLGSFFRDIDAKDIG